MLVDARDYALREATPDVRDGIRWLEAAGFELRSAQGGSSESFGNILLEYVRGDVTVRIARDRSQWIPVVALAGVSGEHGLQVLHTARTGLTADAGPPRDWAAQPMAEQLPEGMSWRTELPALIHWLSEADRSQGVRQAAVEWREAMKRYWQAVEAQHDV